MTSRPHEEPVPRVLVLDTTCLSHFARADRLDVLRGLLADDECWTTRAVLQELSRGYGDYPALELVTEGGWLRVAQLDTLAEASLFAKWARNIGSSKRDLGEASVFAIAELRTGTAITDDRHAVEVARANGLDVHGTIWVLAVACGNGKLSEAAAGNLVDALRATGLRLPCTGAEFPGYARQRGVL